MYCQILSRDGHLCAYHPNEFDIDYLNDVVLARPGAKEMYARFGDLREAAACLDAIQILPPALIANRVRPTNGYDPGGVEVVEQVYFRGAGSDPTSDSAFCCTAYQ